MRGSDGTSVILSLDAGSPFDVLRAELTRLLGQAPERFRHGSARLDFGDRDLTLFDIRRLVHLLKGEFALTVTGIYTSERALHRFVERELKLRVYARPPAEDWSDEELHLVADEAPTRPVGTVGVVVLDHTGDEPVRVSATAVTERARFDVEDDAETVGHGAPPDGEGVIEDLAYDDEIDRSTAALPPEDLPDHEPEVAPTLPTSTPPVSFTGGRRALTVARTLRGGQRVSFPGDVILFGDVNPGATVEAGGHILVFGSLRGLAHAGRHGDQASVIMAFELHPTQLRIGPHIAFPPEADGRSARGFRPEIAWVHGDRILIDEYRGRLPDPLPAPGSSNPASPSGREEPAVPPGADRPERSDP
ncbi:MAG: hypothetical protein D6798_13105 [Deltaproteobacteria bacterium]|nr:MAG: hypothetical protein D6798_13105 [Deltaproteobacteria bacterium]